MINDNIKKKLSTVSCFRKKELFLVCTIFLIKKCSYFFSQINSKSIAKFADFPLCKKTLEGNTIFFIFELILRFLIHANVAFGFM